MVPRNHNETINEVRFLKHIYSSSPRRLFEFSMLNVTSSHAMTFPFSLNSTFARILPCYKINFKVLDNVKPESYPGYQLNAY